MLMEKQYLMKLMNCQLFRDMTEAEITDALCNINYRVFKIPRKHLYAIDGASCNNTDIILSGSMVATMVGESGRQMVVIRIGCGDVIAACYYYGAIRELPVSLESETEMTILRFSQEALRKLVDSNPVVRWNYVCILSDIATYFASKIGFLSLLTVREKVIQYIKSEVKANKSLKIVLDKSRQKLADMFAVQKYSLQRALNKLSAEGIIHVDGREITVVNVRGLSV